MIRLRSGEWRWRLVSDPDSRAGVELHLSVGDGCEEMVGPVPTAWADFSEAGIHRLLAGVRERRFPADGRCWTAQVRSVPRHGYGTAGNGAGASLVLFRSKGRACLSTFALKHPLTEMKTDELRCHLHLCLET